MDKIHVKWGFGNAPLKDTHIAKTENAISEVIAILASPPQTPTVEQLDSLSHIKGQFTRMVKQDQWDWFTVWARFGRPSRQPASIISWQLGQLRISLKSGDLAVAQQCVNELQETGIDRYFDNFLTGERENSQQPEASGFIYILSTRVQPRILKIGVTQRTVEIRVKEINAATGVMVPYGVRAVWRVDDALKTEKELHTLFAPYRIRSDREFFELDYFEASRLINHHLRTRRMLKAQDK